MKWLLRGLVGLLLALLLVSGAVSYLAYSAPEEVAGCVDGPIGRWQREVRGDTVIVFVHGILGHTNSTWCTGKASDGPDYWPDRVARDLPGTAVYLAGYDTKLTSSQYDTDHIADDIWDQLLDRRSSNSGQRVIDRKNIIFVAHSMGGIVVRKLLVRRHDEGELRSKCVGVMFYASPHGGSIYATGLSWLAGSVATGRPAIWRSSPMSSKRWIRNSASSSAHTERSLCSAWRWQRKPSSRRSGDSCRSRRSCPRDRRYATSRAVNAWFRDPTTSTSSSPRTAG